MDNRDFDTQRPRKKASRETIRKRQLIALCVIALLVLILILLIAKACAPSSKGGETTPTATTTTAVIITTTTDPALTTTVATTTTAPAEPENNSDFKLDKYVIELAVGGKDMPRVQEYPEGSGEWNENWSSSDENIATVDKWGNITGVAEGECTITLRDGLDTTQEVNIKVIVKGKSETASEEATTGATTEPQSADVGEAPAPSRINVAEAHYEGDTLIVNKTYSLPQSYDPGDLDPTCKEWFYKLANGAAKDGLNIYISSGYRSYDYQSQIYNNYVGIYGTETADTFSARPGNSEHQSGLAIDVNIIDDSFAGTPEAIWLAEHCWEYGFIIRYPENKQAITGYKYEPWHIRYVGSAISKQIHDMGGDTTLEELFGITSQYQN
ncbi:MAG: D-alanyl-D-alanine carboxypeptidase family protein [Ruminococcus sp.]|nr:D-alanyl-D-alanine carboxypeptidase family protein [Ruminococcus sp.]